LATTCVSTFLVGGWLYTPGPPLAIAGIHLSSFLVGGTVYSLCLMTILLCHEAGHYLQARRHGVRASLPLFIPMPVEPIGTMGAVILMDPRSGDRRALFDIGIAGPLAGLVPTLICCAVGLSFCKRLPGIDEFGEPLLFQWLARWILRPFAPGEVVAFGPTVHPLSIMAHAGWVGLLITSLNLFPIGQLDGGHILYGLLRDWARPVATLVLLGAIAAVFYFRMLWWLLMLFLLVLMGPGHPPSANDNMPLGPWRTMLGWLMLALLPFGFTPTPLPQVMRPVPPQREQVEQRDLVMGARGVGSLWLEDRVARSEAPETDSRPLPSWQTRC
jgi:membrane-associated protease RseP (regulator of RpoE activity)